MQDAFIWLGRYIPLFLSWVGFFGCEKDRFLDGRLAGRIYIFNESIGVENIFNLIRSMKTVAFIIFIRLNLLF